MEIRTPVRATRTYTQRIQAPPERVLRLLCPVREAEWLERWDPSFVVTASGVAEADCVAVTGEGADEAVWVVTRHEPDAGFVEMLKVTPRVTACRIAIRLTASPDGTDAEITYTHTSLGPAGDEFVAAFDEAYYLEFMRDWETRLNHYLATGEMLR
ncbi:MAG: hypothetical protein Q7W30_05660 [Coriobacteriia bacterium]|nr:hypothetical protein [Coriobacteriia bacterium]